MRARNRAAVSAAALLIGAAVLGCGGSAQAAKTLYSLPKFFAGPPLTPDRAGNLYGLIGLETGNGCQATGCATVFRLVHPVAPGQRWTKQTLYAFPASRANGTVLEGYGSQLALDDAGRIYGTCGGGSAGLVWRLSPPSAAGGAWTFTVLHAFTGGSDGGGPYGLVIDHSGTLYGTAEIGGGSGNGVVYSLTPPSPGGSTWTETVLHAFGKRNDGRLPSAPLVLSSHDTVLTGVTDTSNRTHGNNGLGAVFQLRRRGSTWTYHLLYMFPGGDRSPAGALPNGPVVVDQNRTIFGTTQEGGTLGFGAIFELSPPAPGQSAWTEQVIYNFNTTTGGWHVTTGLIAGGSPPALFGTTTYSRGSAVDGSTGNLGQVFRLDPPASGTGPWTYTALHAFGGKLFYPIYGYPSLTFGVHRFLFGVTDAGGKHNAGFIFQVSPHIPASSPTTP